MVDSQILQVNYQFLLPLDSLWNFEKKHVRHIEIMDKVTPHLFLPTPTAETLGKLAMIGHSFSHLKFALSWDS